VLPDAFSVMPRVLQTCGAMLEARNAEWSISWSQIKGCWGYGKMSQCSGGAQGITAAGALGAAERPQSNMSGREGRTMWFGWTNEDMLVARAVV